MTLIKCDECGHDVSTKAASCPNCAAPVMESENSPSTDAETIKPPAQKTSAVTYAARVYFIGGFFVLLSIWPKLGWFLTGEVTGQWLLIGLGVALLAYGYTRQPRDWISGALKVGGWIYTVLVTLAVIKV